MHGYNLVAIYPTLEEARRVSDRLLAEGLTVMAVIKVAMIFRMWSPVAPCAPECTP